MFLPEVHIIFRQTEKGASVHSIESEMKVVDNYITICRHRFSQAFEYKVFLNGFSSFSELNQLIPILGIQIFVENSLEKGIVSLRSNGYIHIQFTLEQEGVSISIEDNGIGRSQEQLVNAEISTLNNRSTKILFKLIELYN